MVDWHSSRASIHAHRGCCEPSFKSDRKLMTNNILSIEDLKVSYEVGNEDLLALHGFSFFVRKGEILAIVGESGSGKSTTVGVIVGLLPQNAKTTGSIHLDGEEILGAPEKRMRPIRGLKIGFV